MHQVRWFGYGHDPLLVQSAKQTLVRIGYIVMQQRGILTD